MPRKPRGDGVFRISASLPREYEHDAQELADEHDGNLSAGILNLLKARRLALGDRPHAPQSDLAERVLRLELDEDKLHLEQIRRRLNLRERRLEDFLRERDERDAAHAHSLKFKTPTELARHLQHAPIGRERAQELATLNTLQWADVEAAHDRLLQEDRARELARVQPVFANVADYVEHYRHRIPDTEDAWRTLAQDDGMNPDEVVACWRRDSNQTWLPTTRRPPQ